MRTVLIGLTLCAALMAPCAAGAAPQAAARPTAVGVTEDERAAFRSEVMKNDLFVVLLAEFPAEYLAFETQLIADAKSGKVTSRIEVRDRASVFMEGFQLKYQAFGGQAGEAEIVELYRRNLEVMKALQRVNLQACYSFGEGSGIPLDISDTLPPETFKTSIAYAAYELKVGISGSRLKIVRQPLTTDEIIPVVETFEKLGGDIAYFSAAEEGRLDSMAPEERCQASLLWTQAIVAQPAAVIARMASTK